MAITHKLTNLDPNQISRASFDEDLNAQRMVLVGGSGITLNADVKFPEAKHQEPIIIKEIEYKEIEKPIILEKIIYKEVEKPIIIRDIEYKEIEKQIIVKEIEYKEIEKPLIIEKEIIKELPVWQKVCIFIQAFALLSLVLVNLLKK